PRCAGPALGLRPGGLRPGGSRSGAAGGLPRSRAGAPIEFHREALPPLAVLAAEWRRLEAEAAPSFFTSWHWIGTLLATLPEGKRPSLLRGLRGGETIALALLGAGSV